MPSQTFAASAIAPATPSEVWERLQIPETWEAINGVDDVFDPVFEGDDLVGFGFHSTAGGRRYRGIASPHVRRENESLGWKIENTEIKGTVTVSLVPVEGGTRIDVEMEVQSVSIMASLGFPLIAGVIGSGFQQTVDDFASDITGG